MFDYHIHSTVSYDGRSTAADLLRTAEAAGLKEICFTDHRDYEQKTPREKTAYALSAYREAYDNLSSNTLALRRGTEVGLATWNLEELNGDVESYPYDFVIGSVHYVNDIDPYFPEYWENRDPKVSEQKYFDEVLRCVQLHDHFDVLGHLTYISKCKSNPNLRTPPLAENKELIAEIMKTLISKGKGMEINTSGINRCGDFLPAVEYLRLFKDLGGSIITVGSDAHNTDRIGENIDLANALAKEIFGHVCTFAQRQPIFHKL